MTDPAAPQPEDLDRVDEPLDEKAIADEARKDFSLSSRLKGINHRTAKVLLFTDVEAVDRHASMNAGIQALVDRIGELPGGDEATPEQNAERERLTQQMTELEPELERLKSEMLKGALAVHLKAFPNIAAKVARRKAFAKYRDPETRQVPEEREEDFSNYIHYLLMGDSIVEIVDSNGDRMDLGPRDQLGEMLSNELPPTQWSRLYGAFMQMTVTDAIAGAITDDPGF